MEDSPSSSMLLCDENVDSLDEGEHEFDSILNVTDDDEEYIRSLLDREVMSSSNGNFLQSSGGSDFIRGARLDGVEYILQKRELLGFKFHTAYLSITYLDRFLSKRSNGVGKSWIMQLLSMACLSLAAKMEEIKVPVLSEFCVEDYRFESNVIQRMELLVLVTLEWKMGSISPFAYTRFFLEKLRKEDDSDDSIPPRDVLSRIGEVLLDTTKDVKIMSYRPSIIVAAATLVVLDQGFSRNALELKLNPLASTLALDIEDLISCYYQVHQMKSGIKSPDLSPIQLQRTEDAFGNSSTSVGSSKRKRLDFDQGDEKKQEHLSFR